MRPIRLFFVAAASLLFADGEASSQTLLGQASSDNPPPATSFLPLTAHNKEFIDALVSVYTKNPQLSAQRESLAATDETVSQAISSFKPSIQSTVVNGRQRSKVGTGGEVLGDKKSHDFTLTQDVFNGGESWANYRSSKDRVKAARAQLHDSEQQIFLAAITAFIDVVEKKSVLGLNQNNVDVLQKQLDATNERFKVGEITKTDVAQAQARLAQARADERQALGNLETAVASFKRLIGYDTPESLELPFLPAALPSELAEAIQLAKKAHPTLENAKSLEKAANSDVDARIGGLLPDVNIKALNSHTEGGSTSGVRVFDNNEITLNVTIPIYQGGAEWSRVRQAKSQAQQAKFNALDAHDAVVENVTRAWQEYNTAQSVINSNEEAMRAAELALEGVKRENEYGERTVLDVLNAEQELFSAKVNLVKAQAEEKRGAYRLLSAVGKLTAKDLSLPVEPYDPTEHYDNVKYQLIGF